MLVYHWVPQKQQPVPSTLLAFTAAHAGRAVQDLLARGKSLPQQPPRAQAPTASHCLSLHGGLKGSAGARAPNAIAPSKARDEGQAASSQEGPEQLDPTSASSATLAR